MPIPGLDARGVTWELKLRLKFYCSWTWWVFLLLLLFFCDIIVGFYYDYYSYFLLFFLYYQLHHHYLLILIFTTITLPPSPVLQSIVFLPIYSFCPSHPLCLPDFTPASHPPPTCHHTTPPSYTLANCWLTYCTNFTQPKHPAIPDIAPYTTITKIHPNTHKSHKTQ
jgi:hypothetical protein